MLAGFAGLALLAGGLVTAVPPASAATTWTFPSGEFILSDGFGSTATVTIQNLTISDTTTGYVRLTTTTPRLYVCTTQVFSGTSAQFWPDSIAPCTGSITFSLDPATGALTASADLSVSSRFYTGPGSGSVTAQSPTVVPLADCALAFDSTGGVLAVGWTANPGASTYDIAVSGSGNYTTSTNGGTGGGPQSALIAMTSLSSVTVTPGTDPVFRADITGKRSDGAVVATCTTPDATVPGPGAPTIVGKPVAVAAGGLLTVNYSVPDSPFVQGIEYRLDNGPWLRPGGQAPVGGLGGAFTVSGITAKRVDVTLRTVGTDPTGPVLLEGAPTTVTFPVAPSGKPPAASGVATGSSIGAPVAGPPAAPVSSVSGTSNGAGSGSNGALAASTGDAGIDAPCLAADGTLYPNQYSTVGSQLTMAPNTRGMGSPKSFTVVDGALPPGMQLDRRYGVLFGVTTTAGSWTTTIKATFANGKTRTSHYLTRVDADPQTVQYAARNVGTVGSPTVIAPTTNAPVRGTTYTLVCGVLPDGMRLNSATGVVTGTPTTTVSKPTPLRIAESSSAGTAAASFILVVNPRGVASFSYPAHPHLRAKKRAAIRPTITDPGSFATFRISRGKLPKGLRLSAKTGVITGRAAHAGRTHRITVVGVTKAGALVTAAPVRIRVAR
jgi:hypothetical protein